MEKLIELIKLLPDPSAMLWGVQESQWGLGSYLALAILVAIEGPIATLLGAAAASTGLMRPELVLFAAAAGNLTADTLWYSMGYLGKLEWALRIGKRVGISQDGLERIEAAMQKHAARILFFAKLSVSMVIPSLIAAGLVKIPWRKWFPYVFCAEMIWTGSLVFVGYHATRALMQVEKGIEIIGVIASLIFMGVIIWMGRRLLKAEEE